MNVSVNGAAAVAQTVKKGDKAAIGGQGTLVEIYATDDAKVFDVFVVNTYAYQLKEADISKAVAATATADAVPAFIAIDGMEYETAAFKKDDVVLYTKTASKIVNVVKAAAVVGKVTATAGDNSYFRVDGVQYKKAATNAAVVGTDAGYKYVKDGSEYTYYLDNYGNVIMAIEGKQAEVKAQYVYVTQIAAKAAEGKAVAGGDLFSGTTNTTAAQAQAKVVDLATGAVSVKNVAIVKNTAGKYVYADKTGAATTDEVEDIAVSVVNGVFEYYTLADGSIVFGDAATTTDITVEQNKATIATGLYANSATKLTVVTLTHEKNDNAKAVTSATVATTTGIAAFPKTAKAYSVLVTKDKNNIASELVAVVDKAAETTAVNYAIYKGAGETTADGTNVAFYQKGAVVEYTLHKDFADTLTAGKVYDLTVASGKLTAAAEKTALGTGTVKVVDATYALLTDGTVIYFATAGCEVYDEDTTYAAAALAAKDVITFYGESVNKVAYITIAK
jgi:hypothetical protein